MLPTQSISNKHSVLHYSLNSTLYLYLMGFPGGSDGKESACNVGDLGLIPGLGRSPGGGYSNPLQYSCLENPHAPRSLVGYSPWAAESDMTDRLSTAHLYLTGTSLCSYSVSTTTTSSFLSSAPRAPQWILSSISEAPSIGSDSSTAPASVLPTVF